MENLFVGWVRWCTDLAYVENIAEVEDVCENNISWLAIMIVVLPASNRSYVSWDASIDDDVLFARMLVYGQPTKDFETMAMVYLTGDSS
jgi:hypothetical protein